MGKDAISINRDMVDLRYVEQLADVEQLTTLGYLLKYAELHLFDGKKSLQQVIDSMMKLMEERGLAEICEQLSADRTCLAEKAGDFCML